MIIRRRHSSVAQGIGLFFALLLLLVLLVAPIVRFTYRHTVVPLVLWLRPTCKVFYRRWVYCPPSNDSRSLAQYRADVAP